MNYRHAYHAGNFADVLKHLVLCFVIGHLKKKPKPFRVIDTHAGIGIYDLQGDEASRTGEWVDGIGRLLAPRSDTADATIIEELAEDPVVADYLEVVRSFNSHASEIQPSTYPGSPALAAQLLRPGDTLIANELHPDDAATLRTNFARNRQVKILSLDGWLIPKSTLPPKERRGVVLIDPPFEVGGEFDRMHRALSDGLRRFEGGIYLLWYPIKDMPRVTAFRRQMSDLVSRTPLNIELFVKAPDDAGLAGTGLLVVNPPFGLKEWLENVMPRLCEILRQSGGARWSLEELPPSAHDRTRRR